jgi:hypothetical protein
MRGSPTLAIAEELQQQVQDFDGFCGVARMHDNGSRSERRQGLPVPPRAVVQTIRSSLRKILKKK